MKALSLFGVFALAKLSVLIGSQSLTPWWAIAVYFWQDAFVALAFAVLERFTKSRPVINWVSYGLLVAYTAVNVPLLKLFSSPITWQMSRAASGTLADSIRYYLTVETAIPVMIVLVGGICFPWVARKLPPRAYRIAAFTGVGLAVLGAALTRYGETSGLRRNAVLTFVGSAFVPRITPATAKVEWRTSRFGSGNGTDLREFAGVAAGRNVILILLESTGSRSLRPYGAKLDPMPRLSALVTNSIRFENAYAVYPESIKGLFTVVCSRYVAPETSPEIYERVETPSLAQVLGGAGYRTALFHSGRFDYLGMNSVIRGRGFGLLEDAGDIGGNHQSSFGVDEASTVRRVLEWIDSVPTTERFFLTYLPIAGHHPYESSVPGPFPNDTEPTRYLNALHDSDVALGALMDGLDARNLSAQTLFIIMGDHGEAFGQHPGNAGHTFFIYDENVRVPFFILAPGQIKGQLAVDRPASLLDTAPTVLDLLGLPIPPDYQGLSLLPPRERMALFHSDYSLLLLGLRDGPWKFIHEIDSGRSQLFHLLNDPDESTDVAAIEHERVAYYRAHLRSWAAAQKDLIVQDPINLLRVNLKARLRPDDIVSQRHLLLDRPLRGHARSNVIGFPPAR